MTAITAPPCPPFSASAEQHRIYLLQLKELVRDHTQPPPQPQEDLEKLQLAIQNLLYQRTVMERKVRDVEGYKTTWETIPLLKEQEYRDHGIYLPGENDVGQQEETAQPEKDKQSEGKKKSPIKDVKSTEIKLISTNQKEILDEQAQDSGTEDMMKMDIDEDIELVKDEPITLSEEEENGFRKTLDDLTRETLLRKAMVQEEKRLIDIKSRVTEQLRRKERDVETLNSELQSIIKYIDSRSPLHALLASSDQVQDAETRDRKTSEGEIEEDDNVGSVNTSAMQSSSKNKTDDAIQVD